MIPNESLSFPHTPRPLWQMLWVGLRVGLHLLYGAILAVFYPHLSTTRQRLILQRWSRDLLDILHITRHIASPPPASQSNGSLLVANHVSWLDIFVLNSVVPTCFVAKAEVQHWPLIGWLCRRSGTLFIQRDTRNGLVELNQQVAHHLSQTQTVGIFPEGTTTEGDGVGDFYPALFQGAVQAQATTLPACLYYHDPQGKHSQIAAYAGATSLLDSILSVLRCHDLHIALTFLPALAPQDRRSLARQSHAAISAHLTHAKQQAHALPETMRLPIGLDPAQSAYSLLIEPMIHHVPK